MLTFKSYVSMAKIRKNISIEDTTDQTIKKLAKDEMRTESAVVELAIKQYAAKKKLPTTKELITTHH